MSSPAPSRNGLAAASLRESGRLPWAGIDQKACPTGARPPSACPRAGTESTRRRSGAPARFSSSWRGTLAAILVFASLSYPARAEWVLQDELSDDFDAASGLDTSKWDDALASWGNDWHWRAENVTVADGTLRLQMQWDPEDGGDPGCASKYRCYSSGIVRSKLPPLLYGRVVARLKAPQVNPGASAAFWLFRNEQAQNGWWTEIDALETGQGYGWGPADPRYTNLLYNNLHRLYHPLGSGTGTDGYAGEDHPLTTEWNPSDGFHAFEVRWSREKIEFYVDGELWSAATNLWWHQPLDVVASLGLQAPYRDDPTPSGFPTTMEVDSIRVYKEDFAPNGGFEYFVGTDFDQDPKLWTTTGPNPSAGYVRIIENNPEARSGHGVLTHFATSPYEVAHETTITDLPTGDYTLRAWARSSTGHETSPYYAEIRVEGYGGPGLGAPIDPSPTYRLYEIRDVHVSSGQAKLVIRSSAPANKWIRVDDVEFVRSDTCDPQESIPEGGSVSAFIHDVTPNAEIGFCTLNPNELTFTSARQPCACPSGCTETASGTGQLLFPIHCEADSAGGPYSVLIEDRAAGTQCESRVTCTRVGIILPTLPGYSGAALLVVLLGVGGLLLRREA